MDAHFREQHFRRSWTEGPSVGCDSDGLYADSALRASAFGYPLLSTRASALLSSFLSARACHALN